MNPSANAYAHTLEVTRRVHSRLMEWIREILILGGLDSVTVKGRFMEEDAAGPTVTVFPYQMGAWPKMIETNPDIPILGMAADREGIVPPAWQRIGSLLTECMVEVYPVDPQRGSRPARVRPVAPLPELPAPLREWYEAQGDDGGTKNWTIARGRMVSGRLPSLSWKRPLNIRHIYLVLANDSDSPSGQHSGLPFGLSALSVVVLGIQTDRVVPVMAPPLPIDPALLDYIAAMAASVGGERGDELTRLLDVVRNEFPLNVALLPFPDLPSDDTAEVMRALDKPMQPMVHLGVQIGVGAFPVFEPSVAPVFATSRMGDEAQPEKAPAAG